jgi:glycosyltransferase involved in cell wall biosynthesis
MIKVLHTIDTTGPGGAETVFTNLASGLDPQRFESVVAISGPGWVCDTLRKKGLEPIFIQSGGGFNFKYLLSLIHIIRQHNINVIQSHLLGSNLYCSLAGLICRVPVISTFHGFVDSSSNDRLIAIKRRIINLGSTKIVYVSEHLRKYFIHEFGFSASKSMTIYNGVDTTIFLPKNDDSIRKEFGLSAEHVLVGAVGNIRPAKGYHTFLKAAKLVRNKYPDCKFVIAGEGSGSLLEDLIRLQAMLHLQEHLIFLGFRADASKILNNLDIFVLPSVSEGFSISTIEAMACKVPVVVTRSGGPEEFVINGQNGIIVDCDEKQLAASIIRLMENRGLIKKITQLAHQQVADNFSLTAMISKYQEIFVR